MTSNASRETHPMSTSSGSRMRDTGRLACLKCQGSRHPIAVAAALCEPPGRRVGRCPRRRRLPKSQDKHMNRWQKMDMTIGSCPQSCPPGPFCVLKALDPSNAGGLMKIPTPIVSSSRIFRSQTSTQSYCRLPSDLVPRSRATRLYHRRTRSYRCGIDCRDIQASIEPRKFDAR